VKRHDYDKDDVVDSEDAKGITTERRYNPEVQSEEVEGMNVREKARRTGKSAYKSSIEEKRRELGTKGMECRHPRRVTIIRGPNQRRQPRTEPAVASRRGPGIPKWTHLKSQERRCGSAYFSHPPTPPLLSSLTGSQMRNPSQLAGGAFRARRRPIRSQR